MNEDFRHLPGAFFGALAGASVMAIGGLLPWRTLDSTFGMISRTEPDGMVVLVWGVVVVLVLLATLRKWTQWSLVLLELITLVVAIPLYSDGQEVARWIRTTPGGQLGIGAVLVVVGLVTMLACIESLRQQLWRVAQKERGPTYAQKPLWERGSRATPKKSSLPKSANSPGWRPDPSGRGDRRWWDGTAWTENVVDAEGKPLPPDPIGTVGS